MTSVITGKSLKG